MLIGVAVLLLHLLLGWVWPRAGAPQRVQPSTPSPGVVVLLPPPTPQRVPPQLATKPSIVPSPARSATSRRTAPAPAPAATEPAAPAVASDTARTAEPSAAPLTLALPPEHRALAPRSMREQVRDDPRANSPRPTLESRVTAVSGTREWTEQRMDATRTRFRKDGHCIEVHVARNAQLDPWNQNHAPTPKAVKPEC